MRWSIFALTQFHSESWRIDFSHFLHHWLNIALALCYITANLDPSIHWPNQIKYDLSLKYFLKRAKTTQNAGSSPSFQVSIICKCKHCYTSTFPKRCMSLNIHSSCFKISQPWQNRKLVPTICRRCSASDWFYSTSFEIKKAIYLWWSSSKRVRIIISTWSSFCCRKQDAEKSFQN